MVVTAPTITTEMNAAMSAYSMAVPPDSSFTKAMGSLNTMLVLLHVAVHKKTFLLFKELAEF